MVYATLNECWDFQPLGRPSFDELHKFFSTATPGMLTEDPLGGIFLQDGNFNAYTALEAGGSGDGSGGSANDGHLHFGFEEEEEDASAKAGATPLQGDNIAPYGATAIKLHPKGGLRGATRFATDGTPIATEVPDWVKMRKMVAADKPKLYGVEKRKPDVITEYLPIGKKTYPGTKPGAADAAVAAAENDDEAFDGFYENRPDPAAHDRAIREARAAAAGTGNAGGDASGGGDLSTKRTMHIAGIGEVEIFADTQPSMRDAGDEIAGRVIDA